MYVALISSQINHEVLYGYSYLRHLAIQRPVKSNSPLTFSLLVNTPQY